MYLKLYVQHYLNFKLLCVNDCYNYFRAYQTIVMKYKTYTLPQTHLTIRHELRYTLVRAAIRSSINRETSNGHDVNR